MPSIFQGLNLGDETKQVIRHVIGEAFSDRILGGKIITKDEKGQIKYKPLSSDDNALLGRLISRTAAKMASAALTAEEEGKFSLLLSGTAAKFKMVANSPLKVWPAFLGYLTKQNKPPVNLLKQKLMGQHRWTLPLSSEQQYQLAEELKKALKSPFVRLLLGMEVEQAKLFMKDFCDLSDDVDRLAFYQPYLSLANVQDNSPAVILPAFFRYLYEQVDSEAKNKLAKRVAIGLKHLSRHMGGILQKEGSAIQWLGIPFIELMKCMAVQSQDDTELFLATFCNLPDHQARMDLYQTVMAQPEHPVDLAIRMLDSIINQVKTTRSKLEQSFDDSKKPGGWRDKNRKFRQIADKFNEDSKLYY